MNKITISENELRELIRESIKENVYSSLVDREDNNGININPIKSFLRNPQSYGQAACALSHGANLHTFLDLFKYISNFFGG